MTKSKKIKWGHSYARLSSIHKLDIYLLNMEKELKKFFPKGMNNLLAIGKKHDVKWHFDDNQFDELGEFIFRKTLKDVSQGTNHIQEMINQSAQAIKKISNFDKVDFSLQDNSELQRSFSKFLEAIDSSLPIIYSALVIDNQLFEHARKILSTVYNGKALKNNFDIVIALIEPSPVIQMEIDLLKILAKKNKGEQLRNDLGHMRKKYCWFGMRFIDNKPLTVKDLSKHLADLKKDKWEKRLLNYKKEYDLRKNDFNRIISQFSLKEKRFLKFVNQYSTLRHERDIYRGSAYYYEYFLCQEIKKRFKISISDITLYTVDEFKNLIKTRRKVERNKIQNRKKHFVYLLIDGKRKIIDRPQEIKRIIKECLGKQKTVKQIKEIRGQVACVGKTKGIARIMRFNTLYKDLRNFKKGEIMVTESTKPEYVLAMKKAAAIVTNEGGLTCHAAIVSRELKIPCVIGTKTATKILKGGYLVEVDANRGIVRVLKK